MNFRTEHDTMGEIRVPAEKFWGAQTQRSLENFPIGWEKMPQEIIKAFAYLKLACASSNLELNPKMTKEKFSLIEYACREILSGKLNDEFPLVVWQTGSGTQSNMNVNEVIANVGNRKAGEKVLHPNDDVNMSQSSNDTFPSAMNIAAVTSVKTELISAVDRLISVLDKLEKENSSVIKIGRTHLQDAVPLTFGQEISGWKAMLETDRTNILNTLSVLSNIAIGGTAVGTGLNAPKDFGKNVCEKLSSLTSIQFVDSPNKFHALTSLDRMVFAHGALKALAADLMKIANDIRLLASGPRCGLGEITIPSNEPGSSIMPGKVNPTQCEAVTMIALQVIGNDTTISMAATQGNFELNVFLPVTAYNFLQSVRLLTDGINSFTERCVSGIKANESVMKNNMEKSLMTVTCLSPVIGYDKAAETTKKAFSENITLKEACIKLGYLTEKEFDENYHPEKMI
ncbi:MAG: class II fumarate hydratase [Clostridia bacterium]|nr:class II fumarate hydratase [Clostridia bacterium]